MNFDIPTLMTAGALATAVAGLLIAVAWVHDREAHALPWWSAAYFLLAGGIVGVIFARTDPREPIMMLASFIFSGSPAFIWAGTRIFGDRRPLFPAMAIGPLLYIVAVLAEPIHRAPQLAAVVSLGAMGVYLALAVVELHIQRAEELGARRPLMFFLMIHAAVVLAGALEAALGLFPATVEVDFSLVFGIIHFEQLIFVMGSAIFMVVMVRERSELRHKTAARVDTLTGLATRRAFLDRSEKLLLECLSRDAPLALVICDLDRFKVINDTHGHATGDLVLQMFAHIARGRLRLEDVMGRLGGEEFAIVMPGATWEAALTVAERIRVAFAEARVPANGETISSTVSAGVAAARHSSTVGRLLAEADAALYRAKAQGRNRVEIADRDRHGNDPAQMARVA